MWLASRAKLDHSLLELLAVGDRMNARRSSIAMNFQTYRRVVTITLLQLAVIKWIKRLYGISGIADSAFIHGCCARDAFAIAYLCR